MVNRSSRPSSPDSKTGTMLGWQRGRDADFEAEAIRSEQVLQLGMENLDGDRAAQVRVEGANDGRHAPTSDFTLDLVAGPERVLEGRPDVGHAAPHLPSSAILP